MKHRLNFILKLGILSLFMAALFASCVPLKRIQYLQQDVNKHDTVKSNFISKNHADYRIQSGDNLYIKVYSALAKKENFFQEDISTSSNYYNDQGIYLNSYMVDDSGFIDFPFVGNVYIKGLRLVEAKDLIKSIVDDYIKGTSVIVKIVAFKISILGEIGRPGEYTIYDNKFNIFDAIAMAGDLTTMAKRNNVMLVRETTTGSVVKHLDLNSADILESDFYYLLPGDVIYIPPVKGKNFAFVGFPYALVLSTITTTLLLINFFKTN